MVLRQASGKGTVNLLHKMSIPSPQPNVWNNWEPKAVLGFYEETS